MVKKPQWVRLSPELLNELKDLKMEEVGGITPSTYEDKIRRLLWEYKTSKTGVDSITKQ